jgi:hypothetical protein
MKKCRDNAWVRLSAIPHLKHYTQEQKENSLLPYINEKINYEDNNQKKINNEVQQINKEIDDINKEELTQIEKISINNYNTEKKRYIDSLNEILRQYNSMQR